MFTGIIEGLGTITGVNAAGRGKRLTIQADFPLTHTQVGDSIAVSGACLTATTLDGKRFTVDVSPETVGRTTLVDAKIGDRVNLERALRLSDRLDGHLVSGHIDGKGRVTDRKTLSNAVIISFDVSPELTAQMIPKGSVAVDGVSLTINRLGEGDFEVSIIPHTANLTTVGYKNAGDWVNIETDMIGKYVARFLIRGQGPKTGGETENIIDMAFLAKNGFL